MRPLTMTLFAMSPRGEAVVRMAADKFPSLVQQVVIGRDKAVASDSSTEIQAICEQRGISCCFRESGIDVTSDYAIAIAWRWLLDFPQDRLIVLHDSLLPRYRGFAPVVNALINGEREIGVTAIYGAREYDRGDIIAQSGMPVQYPMTIRGAIEQNIANYTKVAERVFEFLQRGERPPATSQCDADASYSIWRAEEDYRIDWTGDAARIRRFIDAVGEPYAGAVTYDGDRKVIVDTTEEVPDVRCELRDAGKVIFLEDGMPTVICGKGLLRITSARVLSPDAVNPEPYLPLRRFRVRLV